MKVSIERIRRSLALPLILLAGAFIAVPVALYSILEQAYQSQQDVLTKSVQVQAHIIAAAITPTLNAGNRTTFATAASELARFSGGDARIQLIFRPGGGIDALGFYLVAQSSTAAPSDQGQAEPGEALRRIAAEACAGGEMETGRYRDPSGLGDALASVVPARTANGCWALLFAYPAVNLLGADHGQSFYQRPEVKRAAILYVGLALLTVCVIVALQRNLKQFRQTASAIRQHTRRSPSFRAENQIAEFERVADDLDRLVVALRRGADQMRRRIEDDAHAFKTPLAILHHSIEPISRGLPEGNEEAKRALAVLSQMVERLYQLVDQWRRIDDAVAEQDEPPLGTAPIARYS
jgi:two-component system sensor histidine kinase ChvG